MWKTGHSLIKQKMKETGAVLAGEMSGHIFFADRYFGFDDAVYASLRLLEILANSGKRIPELLADLPAMVATPEIRVPTAEESKFRIVEKAREYLAARHPVAEVDGVRVLFEDGWGLIRASNTQPVLVLRFEACSRERLAEIQAYVEGLLEKIKAEHFFG